MFHSSSMVETEDLVRRTVAGEPAAWRALQEVIEPAIVRIARGHSGMRRKGLASLPDDIAEIRIATLERLARADFQNLRRFLERSATAGEAGAQGFDSWLYTMVDFVIREHLRKRYGRAPKPTESVSAPRPSKRDLHSHAGRFDDELSRSLLQTVGLTTRLTLGEIFEFIDAYFSAVETQAIRLYFMEEQSFEDIARAIGLEDAKSAERLVRRLNARLRYRFIESARSAAGDSQRESVTTFSKPHAK